MLATAMRLAADPSAAGDSERLDFGVYTRFNLPSFAPAL